MVTMLNFKIDQALSIHDYIVSWDEVRKTGFLWWKKVRTIRLHASGGSTVWHYYPTGNRCPNYIEAWICDRMEQARIRGLVKANKSGLPPQTGEEN